MKLKIAKMKAALIGMKDICNKRSEVFEELLEELDGKVMNYSSLNTLRKVYEDANTSMVKAFEMKIRELETKVE